MLVASLSFYSCDKEEQIPLPKASFTISTNPEYITDTIFFQNTSIGADSVKWFFGDGSSSTDEHPFHLYSKEGDYSVFLSVSNETGRDDTTITIAILPPFEQVVEFSVYSPGLENNLLDDSPNRPVNIYLPLEYKD